ncbi:hypothetical protein CRE_00921 [Caenorhabditis remanei]|uniref:Uncharacterized protein n=1 Tax=Caenorhabditis remanei TaxID=31234 RepID=E3LCP0_CAERE|nr:hypothetical protein CRE_00921 [Caenorhabditis remanei]
MEAHPKPEFYQKKIKDARNSLTQIEQLFERTISQQRNRCFAQRTLLSDSPDFDYLLNLPNNHDTLQSESFTERGYQSFEIEIRTLVLNLVKSIGFEKGFPFIRDIKTLKEYIKATIDKMENIEVPRLQSCRTQHRAEQERVEQSWREFSYLREGVVQSMEQTQSEGQHYLSIVYIWCRARVQNFLPSDDLQDKFIEICDELYPISFVPLRIPRLPSFLEFQPIPMEKTERSQLSQIIRKFKTDFNEGINEIVANVNHVLATDYINKVKRFREDVNEMIEEYSTYARQLAEVQEKVEVLNHRVLNAQIKCLFISETLTSRYNENLASCTLMENYQTAVWNAQISIRNKAMTDVEELTEQFGYLII